MSLAELNKTLTKILSVDSNSNMDKHQEAVDYLKKWIVDFVSKNHPDLGNFPPCPFAKQAMIEDKITFQEVSSVKHCVDEILKHSKDWNDDIDVHCLVFDNLPLKEELVKSIEDVNSTIMPEDFVVLEDHPDIEENINGVIMNNGAYAICLMQRLTKIQRFSNILKKQGYYKVWTKENLDEVVNWRSTIPDS